MTAEDLAVEYSYMAENAMIYLAAGKPVVRLARFCDPQDTMAAAILQEARKHPAGFVYIGQTLERIGRGQLQLRKQVTVCDQRARQLFLRLEQSGLLQSVRPGVTRVPSRQIEQALTSAQ